MLCRKMILHCIGFVTPRIIIILNNLKIVSIFALGEKKPSRVRADVTVNLNVRNEIKAEWENLRKHDVCFLITVRPTCPIGMIQLQFVIYMCYIEYMHIFVVLFWLLLNNYINCKLKTLKKFVTSFESYTDVHIV